MRTYEEIVADGRKGSAFSNMTEFEIWAPRWCQAPCAHDDPETDLFCPVLSASMMGVVPKEWTPGSDTDGRWRCAEFRQRPDDYDPAVGAGPVPELPGQLDLFGGMA